jgi:hypothetical protein
MRNFFAAIKRWWLRRYRGIVEPPAHAKGHGTIWQQWGNSWGQTVLCPCGQTIEFLPQDYVIRDQSHIDGCHGLIDAHTHHAADLDKTPLMDLRPCQCPVTDARYIKICPNCRRGHWKQAQ